MHNTIEAKRAEIAALCRAHGVRRLDVFGSAARGRDFDPTRSDVDVLVEFDPIAQPSPLTDFLGFQQALAALLGRPVDLVERGAIEKSRNYIRRGRILGEAQPLYVA